MDLINGVLEKNQMERKIEINGKWYSTGEYIEINDNAWFSSIKKCRIDFIGDDSALINDDGIRKTIVGKVNVNN